MIALDDLFCLNMEMHVGERGAKLYVDDSNHIYRSVRVRKSTGLYSGNTQTRILKCILKKCTGELHVFNSSRISHIMRHNHPPDLEKLETLRFKSKLSKRILAEPTTGLKQIFNEEKPNLNKTIAKYTYNMVLPFMKFIRGGHIAEEIQQKCALSYCKSNNRTLKMHEFYRFPDNPGLLQKWTIALERYPIRKHEKPMLICSKHFKKSQFQQFDESHSKLSAYAVPNIFDGCVLNTPSPSKKESPSPSTSTSTTSINFNNSSIAYGLNTTCRTCLKTSTLSNQSQFYFNNLNSSISNYASTVSTICTELSYLKLQVSLNDGLPQQICNDCMNYLTNLNSFRTKCIESQNRLINYFQKYASPPQSAAAAAAAEMKIHSEEIELPIRIKTENNDNPITNDNVNNDCDDDQDDCGDDQDDCNDDNDNANMNNKIIYGGNHLENTIETDNGDGDGYGDGYGYCYGDGDGDDSANYEIFVEIEDNAMDEINPDDMNVDNIFNHDDDESTIVRQLDDIQRIKKEELQSKYQHVRNAEFFKKPFKVKVDPKKPKSVSCVYCHKRFSNHNQLLHHKLYRCALKTKQIHHRVHPILKVFK